MTREERTKLINHLKYNRSIGADYLLTDKDADEIIKALEQEPILDKIRAEIEALPRELPTDARNMVRRTRVLDIIDKYRKEQTDAT